MPVPTDTYWNISRLNKVFALSAVILLGVMGWATIQDFDKQWRAPQKSGKAWEAALVSEKLIDRDGTEAEAAKLDKEIAETSADLASKEPRYKQLTAQIAKTTADLANLDFRTNTLKAVVGEQLKFLEEAKSNNDTKKVDELNTKLAKPQETLAQHVEDQAKFKEELFEKKKELAQVTAELDKIKKARTKKTEDRDALKKKLNSLQPQTILGKASAFIRDQPLLQFVNPSEAVKQQVLPDVLTDLGGFKTVAAIDRCVTCHVNIDKKDFVEEKVLAYLEEQLATSRGLKLPASYSGKAGDPVGTQSKPGALAMPEFWLKFAAVAAPDTLKKPAIVNRIKTLSATIGKSATVTVDGKPLTAFTFTPDAAKKDDAGSVALGEEGRQAVASQLIDAWIRSSKDADVVSTSGNVAVTISKDLDEKVTAAPRKAAMVVAEDLKNTLSGNLKPDKLRLVLDRYRRTLIADVNVARKSKSMSQLDPSRVMLAHPRLDLYTDVDSKHPMEKVGCTSCHDGSGQETRFILAAHVPRPIWVDKSTGAPILAQQLKLAHPPEAERPMLDNMLHAIYPEGAIVPSAVDDMHLHMGSESSAAAHGEHDEHAKPAAPTTKPAEVVEIPDDAPEYTDTPVDYVDPITGKKGKAVSQLTYWKAAYEAESGQPFERTMHEWDTPMRRPQYIQANCVRCHTSVADIKEVAPVVYEGRHLFNNLGCSNCHQMDSIPAAEQRKVGTDLRHVTAKLSPAMINTWIWSPKGFRPTTKMPHFFMLENNSSDEEIRRTRQEARAMTEYLVQTADSLLPKHVAPSGLVGKVEDGRKVFNNIGCLACHQNLNDPALGDPKRAGKVVTRGEQWIIQDLVLGGDLAKKMTLETGKAPAAAELTAEATKLFDGMSYNERQVYVLEHLDADKNKTGADTYEDSKKTVKPVFMHHGPELSGVGTKLLADRKPEEARAFLYDWLKEPRHYSSYTVMPSLRLSDQQTVDLAEYLLAQKRTNANPDDQWKASLTETDTSKLIELTGLFLRSRYSPNTATAKADDITELRALATDALTTATISADTAKAKVAAMESAPGGKDQLRQVFLGKKLISHYGCMQCHAINGAEAMASPCANLSDWGQKLVSKLDFGYVDPHKSASMPDQKLEMVNAFSTHAATMTQPMKGEDWGKEIAQPVTAAWPEVHHGREAWLTQKLRNTRIWDRGKQLLEPTRLLENGKMKPDSAGFPMVKDPGKPYDKIKMPTFYLSDEEIDSIVTFVISNRDRLISEKLTNATANPQAKRIAHGRYLVTEKFNCTSCHLIEANKPQIQQYFPDETKIPANAPPQLRSEGSRVQHAWLFGFVKNVMPLRPPLVEGIRMPSFSATDEEWTAIIAYFNDVANKESRELKKDIQPILNYKKAAVAAAGEDSDDAGSDWFTQTSLAGSVSHIRNWAVRYKQVSENRMPLVGNPADMKDGYENALYRARLTAEAFEAPYPFVDTPTVNMTPERFARGEAFFLEMDCLKCHTMGPAAPGTAPTAPNLQMAHDRIRRGWAERWVRHPDVIHKNSPMLPLFTGEKINDPRGQTWARAQEAPLDAVARTEAAYGSTPEEQIALVLDFVYESGVRKHNVVPLPAGSPAPSVTMEKKGEIKVVPIAPPKPKSVTTKPAAPAKPTEAAPAAPAAPKAVGTVGGKVSLAGPAPEVQPVGVDADPSCAAMHPNGMNAEQVVVSAKGELKNVIVSVSAGLTGPFEVPSTPAILTQHGCQYFPHVLPMMVGQKFVVKNDDPFLHNVHGLPSDNAPFNFGQPNKDPGKDIGAFKKTENFRVKCDVHPWMGMNIAVFDHPYFATSGDDGTFTLPPLPAGTYTLTFWHEKFGTQEKEVVVEAGKKAELSISFSQ